MTYSNSTVLLLFDGVCNDSKDVSEKVWFKTETVMAWCVQYFYTLDSVSWDYFYTTWNPVQH